MTGPEMVTHISQGNRSFAMNVLFDLDGTLTDPYEGITKCISNALLSMGRQSPNRKDLLWCIGPPLKDSFATLLGSKDPALIEQALFLYRERFSAVGMFENEVFLTIPEALGALKEMGHILYVATAKPVVFAQQILSHFGLATYFAAIYGSELDGTRSDKSDLISYIVEQESIVANDTVMIGDRKHDMIGARNNGVSSIGVLWGYGTRGELEASGAEKCIDRPLDLLSLL